MPRLIEKVLGNTFVSRYGSQPHAIARRPLRLSLAYFEFSFLGFSQTRKNITPLFLTFLEMVLPKSNAKLQINIERTKSTKTISPTFDISVIVKTV